MDKKDFLCLRGHGLKVELAKLETRICSLKFFKWGLLIVGYPCVTRLRFTTFIFRG